MQRVHVTTGALRRLFLLFFLDRCTRAASCMINAPSTGQSQYIAVLIINSMPTGHPQISSNTVQQLNLPDLRHNFGRSLGFLGARQARRVSGLTAATTASSIRGSCGPAQRHISTQGNPWFRFHGSKEISADSSQQGFSKVACRRSHFNSAAALCTTLQATAVFLTLLSCLQAPTKGLPECRQLAAWTSPCDNPDQKSRRLLLTQRLIASDINPTRSTTHSQLTSKQRSKFKACG
jgi:hypothetical protein